MRKITLIPGDGIGQEVILGTKDIIDSLNWVSKEGGLNSLISNGAHINKNVTLKEINSNNIGFTALDNINPLNKLISIPHKLLISKKVFKDFLI